jgi:hypothetical protein
MPKWTQREEHELGELLKNFLSKKSAAFRGALKVEGKEDQEICVVNTQPFEDRIEFSVKPFPSSYNAEFFTLLDREVRRDLPGFELAFHSQTHRPRKRTFISAENNQTMFRAKVHSEGFDPYFVYRRNPLKDYPWLLVVMIVLTVFTLYMVWCFVALYQSHGYGAVSGIREVFRALLFG